YVLSVTRIDQNDLEPSLLENLVDRNQSARWCRSCVNVPNARPGVSVQAGSTAATCILDPMSIAAAPKLTGLSSGRSPEMVLGIATPPSNNGMESLGYANRHLPNRDRLRTA